MAILLSVNVGMPRDVAWQGKVVHTAAWKAPVAGRVMVRRLNIDGDGQGDLAGHGGEHRAVMVYQLASYRHWETFLGRPLPDYGVFGENLTVDGLPDDEVCIGDRYRVGDALFEVTQPRVTCYRVGMRMGVPQMASLLVAHRRPGFYCRVIEEGSIGAGDAWVKEAAGDGMSVADVDALLYSADHPAAQLERAVRMRALSNGWRQSFEALLAAGPAASGNAGLASAAPEPSAWVGFREVRVVATHDESALVRSFTVEAVGGDALPSLHGGQFIVLKLTPPPPRLPLIRSYSVSDASTAGRYRISVKRGEGAGSRYLHSDVHEGDVFAISAPRGSFYPPPGTGTVVFWSVGIGVTPLLAMLHERVATADRTQDPVYWIYGARNGDENVFADEVDGLLRQLPHVERLVGFSHPTAADREARRFDVEGRIDVAHVVAMGIPKTAHFLLCGPAPFMAQARERLEAEGYSRANILSERFGVEDGFEPGVVAHEARLPHPPTDDTNDTNEGALVSFVRSGLSVHWNPRYATLLDLAEACDVPVRWSCRSGVCHSCETSLVDGGVTYMPEPLQAPAEGRILICCSTPSSDIQLDL
jgi:ferredoxin-NADP reductase/MOSC domain-containing protein YiiM/ferredoxin